MRDKERVIHPRECAGCRWARYTNGMKAVYEYCSLYEHTGRKPKRLRGGKCAEYEGGDGK